MASFNTAFTRFKGIEFNDPTNVLHKNKGEDGLTYYGIYSVANPAWIGWRRVLDHIRAYSHSMKEASRSAYLDRTLEGHVRDLYYYKYWQPLRLNEIGSQKIAEELFFFYVNIGNKNKVVKYAQSIVDTKVDGVIGSKTIEALNNFSEEIFDREYDKKEISHYKRLVMRYPKRFSRFLNGWINRANMI